MSLNKGNVTILTAATDGKEAGLVETNFTRHSSVRIYGHSQAGLPFWPAISKQDLLKV